MKKERKPVNKKQQFIYGAIVILLFIIAFKSCFSTEPKEEKVYTTSKEWLENDYKTKGALMTVAEKVVKDVEKLEAKMNWTEYKYSANDKGIYDENDKFYKYDYSILGSYTDKSTTKIYKFKIDIAYEDDAAMKEKSPYAVLFYANLETGNGFNHINMDKLINK